jgi:hypothetical protein
MSTESDFGTGTPGPRQSQKQQPPQRDTRRPAEGVDPADPAAPEYDRPPADKDSGPQERSPRDPAEGAG